MKNFLSDKNKKTLIDLTQSLVISIAVCLFIFVFIITPNFVEGSSMYPNYVEGDRLYTNRLSHWLQNTSLSNLLNIKYNRGDVVVINKPGMLAIIKRIIGMPGETLEIKNGKVYINDNELKEDYLNEVETTGGFYIKERERIAIPIGMYIVMGDNRTVSNDSRNIGLIKEEWIEGKIFFRLWPFPSFQ